MNSAYAVTDHRHDGHATARGLAAGVKKSTAFLKNSRAILFAKAIFKLDKLPLALQRKPALPGLGCVCTTVLTGKSGHTMPANRLLFATVDCTCGPKTTRSQNKTPHRAIGADGLSTRKQEGALPKRILTLPVPYGNVLDDETLTSLSNVAEVSSLVASGRSSPHSSFKKRQIFLGGGQSLNTPARFQATKSRRNKQLEAHTPSAFGRLQRQKTGPKNSLNFSFRLINLELEQLRAHDGGPVPRNISTINPQRQWVCFTAAIEEKAGIPIFSLSRKKIEQTAGQSLNAACSARKTNCIDRHVARPEYDCEAGLIKQSLSSRMNFTGFCSYREFWPASMQKGAMRSVLQKTSVMACML